MSPAPFDPYQVFHRAAQRFPDRPALRIGQEVHTYAELEAAAEAVAGWCERRSPKGARVAVHGRKRFLAYAGILGVLRSGRSYVPLHPEHPPARWRMLLERAGCAACIADEVALSQLAAPTDLPQLSDHRTGLRAEVTPGDEAYVMFTSGSTGGPKGVPVSRANVSAYIEHFPLRGKFNEDDRFTQLFALTFDLSVHDLFLCWAAGACLCVPPEESTLRVATWVKEQAITCWFSVPSMVSLLKRMRALAPGAFPSLRHSFFCGEVLSGDMVAPWAGAALNSTITNLYGPTEATIAVTAYAVPLHGPLAGGVVPIGTAFQGSSLRILDADPTGAGELMLVGPQVTNGYLDAPDITARVFLRTSDGSPGYRTGDRARIDEQGLCHFLGRMDDQVKILGHRVEPGEVDELLGHLCPQASSLTLAADQGGTVRLVTFIDMPVDVPPLMAALREELPAYMVPERIVVVDGFPTTAHGKVDRAALLERIGPNG